MRRGRGTLRLLAPLVQLGILGMGLAVFLDQSRSLLSDAQFTWGERSVMGVVALVALGGSVLAGWVVGRLIGIAAELFDAMADVAESSRRTTELIEGQVVPTLLRIAAALEQPPAGPGSDRAGAATPGQTLRGDTSDGRRRSPPESVPVFRAIGSGRVGVRPLEGGRRSVARDEGGGSGWPC